MAQARCGGVPGRSGRRWGTERVLQRKTSGRLGVAHSPYSNLSSRVTPLEEGGTLLSVSQLEQLC